MDDKRPSISDPFKAMPLASPPGDANVQKAKLRRSRRHALALLGLAATVAYATPAITQIERPLNARPSQSCQKPHPPPWCSEPM
jgi:hypothetical protein